MSGKHILCWSFAAINLQLRVLVDDLSRVGGSLRHSSQSEAQWDEVRPKHTFMSSLKAAEQLDLL